MKKRERGEGREWMNIGRYLGREGGRMINIPTGRVDFLAP